MKLTKRVLRKLIKEELEAELGEGSEYPEPKKVLIYPEVNKALSDLVDKLEEDPEHARIIKDSYFIESLILLIGRQPDEVKASLVTKMADVPAVDRNWST